MNRSLPTPLEEPVGATFHRYEGMISVAIPVANGEPFLKACLASIVSQTHENMEIVIGENCSTDRTLRLSRVSRTRGFACSPDAGQPASDQ